MKPNWVASKCDLNMQKIAAIETQINLIIKMIPEIKSTAKKVGLIKSIAPVMEKALDELSEQLDKTDKQKKKIERTPDYEDLGKNMPKKKPKKEDKK